MLMLICLKLYELPVYSAKTNVFLLYQIHIVSLHFEIGLMGSHLAAHAWLNISGLTLRHLWTG